MTDQNTNNDKRIAELEAKLNRERRGGGGFPAWFLPSVGGAALGALGLFLYLPETTEPERATNPLPTSQSGEFVDDDPLRGLAVTDEPAQTVVVQESDEARRLREQVSELEQQIKDLRDNPRVEQIVDEGALSDMRDELAAIKAATDAKDAKLRELEADKLRLQSQIDTAALLAEDKTLQAELEEEERRLAQERADELARKRAEAAALEKARISSPMVVSFGGGSSGGAAEAAERDYSDDEAFLRAGAQKATVTRSEVISAPANTVTQGTMIEASLETGILSSLSGTVVAIVSRDVWSADVSQVLIPRGSKLIGRYDNGVDIGQKRVLMAWDRLITPDFQSVQLDAYGADRLGRSGLPGRVNNHFFERFGSAALISIIGAVPNIIANNSNNETADETLEEVADDFSGAVDNVVAEYLSIAPTIAVDQGDIVMVRVNADIELF